MPSKKIILLTGAGFTKNFGGLLADEMWAMIFNHKEVQGSDLIRNNMLAEFNYETVYQKILDDLKADEDEKTIIKRALLSAYEYQENNWQNNNFFLSIDYRIINHLCEFIAKHVGLYFTLNHDLFLERKLIHKFSGRSLHLLADPSDIGIQGSRSALPNANDLFNKQSLIKDQLSDISGLCYVKLHGSINWYDSSGKETLVIVGGNKKEKMKKEPLLNQYYELFSETLLTPGNQLLVIGYGFMDNHINEVIIRGIDKKAIKLHIIDVLSPKDFSEKMAQHYPNPKKMSKEEKNGEVIRESIWLEMSGYYQVNSIRDLFAENGPKPLIGKLIENMELN
ncbi:MAG: SIR2 family protein [Thermodesulfovibrionales bacterium]